MNTAKVIADLREQKEWSQSDLANKSGVSKPGRLIWLDINKILPIVGESTTIGRTAKQWNYYESIFKSVSVGL